MRNKSEFCLRVFRTYGLLIDFEGEPRTKNVPAPIDQSETLKQWSNRVLGSDVTALKATLNKSTV